MKKEKKYRKKLSTFGIGKEKDQFFENLAMLVSSDMTVLDALEALKDDIRSKQLKKIAERLHGDIEDGVPLWKALKELNIISKQALSLVRIGEESGKLSDNLKVVIEQQAKERIFKSRLRSAMMYPVLVMGLAFVIGIGIAWFILPKLSNVFVQLNVDLPQTTKALIWLGEFLGEHGKVAIPALIVGIVIIFFILFHVPGSKRLGQKIIFSTPVIKRLIQEIEIARFGFITGILLEAGLPVLDALKSLKEATRMYAYRQLYAHLEVNVEEGNSFYKSLSSYSKSNKLIPIPVQRLIYSAEKSGTLSETLKSLGKSFENKIETTTKNLTTLLEPIMLVIVWLGVVFVAIAVILPIYSLIGGFNDGTNQPTQNTAQTESQVSQDESRDIDTTEEISTSTIQLNEEDNATTTEEGVEEIYTLQILDTGIGYVNVRENPSIDSPIVSQATTGDIFEYKEFQNGWYKIVINSDLDGWVTEQYVELTEEE